MLNEKPALDTDEIVTTQSAPSVRRGSVFTALAGLPKGTLLDETALSHSLNISTRTLRRMVVRGEVPPGFKLGARKVWFSDRVQDHFIERAKQASSDAERLMTRIGRPF